MHNGLWTGNCLEAASRHGYSDKVRQVWLRNQNCATCPLVCSYCQIFNRFLSTDKLFNDYSYYFLSNHIMITHSQIYFFNVKFQMDFNQSVNLFS